MTNKLDELAKQLAEYHTPRFVSTFHTMWAINMLFLSTLILSFLTRFTARNVAPLILFAYVFIVLSYLLRFVYFGYSTIVFIWRNLRPPYDQSGEVLDFSLSDDYEDIELGPEVTYFAVWGGFSVMVLWSSLAWLISINIENIIGFFEFLFQIVPNSASLFSFILLASHIGLGSTITAAADVSVAEAIRATLTIPLVVLSILITRNATYGIEARLNDEYEAAFPAESGLREFWVAAKTTTSVSLNIWWERRYEFIRFVVVPSLVYLASVLIGREFSYLV